MDIGNLGCCVQYVKMLTVNPAAICTYKILLVLYYFLWFVTSSLVCFYLTFFLFFFAILCVSYCLYFEQFSSVTACGLSWNRPLWKILNKYILFFVVFISKWEGFYMHPRHPGMHIAIGCLLIILSFELNFFVCRHVSIWGFQNRVCPEKRNHPGFVNISHTILIHTYINGKVFTSTTAWKTKKLIFFSKKVEI